MRPPRHAIVRPPGDSYARCVRPPGASGTIDVGLAKEQHDAYAGALSAARLEVVALDADEAHPDSCFVEDTVVLVDRVAVMCRSAVPSRAGEGGDVERVLSEHLAVEAMLPPATMDGGDVLRIGGDLFVGVTPRTNHAAIAQLRDLAARHGVAVVPVEVAGVLHLKSACTCIGDDTVLVCPEHVSLDTFSRYSTVEVPAREGYAANALALPDGTVLVSDGFPVARERIERAGFTTRALEMSEFRKGWGSLTCLSVLF
jgi:dimethylargininase